MNAFLSAAEIDEAISWRRSLHVRPELAFQEHETARFIAEKLEQWGYSVKTGYGRTGVIGSLTKGTSAKSIGIRADMDALPIHETTGAEWASTVPGKMHACGHDGHVSMALAAARAITKLDFDGTVRFIFQPAEETEGGAREMVEGGLFRDLPVDSVYALHNWPALDTGHIVARDDAMMAAFGIFEITIRGRGAHGAMPHEGVDPLVAACQIVTALQTIASRNVSPLGSAVVSVTQVHGGDAFNVIPEQVVIRGTTRWFDAGIGDLIASRMKSMVASIAEGMGCEAVIDYQARYPATINNAECAKVVRDVAVLPEMGLTVVDSLPSMAAEDFSFMLDKVPGCYFWLGSRKAGENPGLHSPRFDFNDDIIPAGANFWVSLVKTALPAG